MRGQYGHRGRLGPHEGGTQFNVAKSHREPPGFYQAAAGGCEEAQQASQTHVAKHVQVNARACASRAQIEGR